MSPARRAGARGAAPRRVGGEGTSRHRSCRTAPHVAPPRPGGRGAGRGGRGARRPQSGADVDTSRRFLYIRCGTSLSVGISLSVRACAEYVRARSSIGEATRYGIRDTNSRHSHSATVSTRATGPLGGRDTICDILWLRPGRQSDGITSWYGRALGQTRDSRHRAAGGLRHCCLPRV